MSSARWLVILAAAALMAQAGYHVGNDTENPPKISVSQLPPLPAVNFVPPRPMDMVVSVFQFAALHPEVLHHIPCFCGCQTMGHRHNDDCFVKSRDARGVPTEWEAHGMGWTVCLDVARDAMQMYSAGTSIANIRSAIEAKYKTPNGTMTPTPPVKK